MSLTEKAISRMAEGLNPSSGNYIVQILHISSISADVHTVSISDGVGQLDTLFTDKAGALVKANQLNELNVIQINNFTKGKSNNQANIIVGDANLIDGAQKVVIGKPIPYAELKANGYVNPNLNKTDEIENKLVKAAAGFGFSTLMGMCAAYFVKKVLRVTAFVAGGFFLTLQFMAYKRLITIHWANFVPSFDVGTFVKILTFHSLGFGTGFYIGIKKEIHKLL